MSRRGVRSHASRLGDPGWPRPQHRHKLPEVSRFNPPPPAPNPTTHNRSHRATATQPFGQFSGQRRFGDSSVSTWGPPELSSQPHGPRTSLAPRAARQRRPPGNRPLNRHLKRSFALYETPWRKGKRREAEAPPPTQGHVHGRSLPLLLGALRLSPAHRAARGRRLGPEERSVPLSFKVSSFILATASSAFRSLFPATRGQKTQRPLRAELVQKLPNAAGRYDPCFEVAQPRPLP